MRVTEPGRGGVEGSSIAGSASESSSPCLFPLPIPERRILRKLAAETDIQLDSCPGLPLVSSRIYLLLPHPKLPVHSSLPILKSRVKKRNRHYITG